MKLSKLLEHISYSILQGSMEEEITDIVYDSRKAREGCIFVCIKGSNLDSHTLVHDVIRKGVRVIMVEHNVIVNEDITLIRTDNSRESMALAAANFFDHPFKKMCMIGLTGTKGKTTSSFMIKEMLEANGKQVGTIGTIGAFIKDKKIKTHNTTPESYELYKIFAEMAEEGCTHCVMEVSSQGLKQNRVKGIRFDIGIFTNFSEDHIGPTEHADMDEYLYYKSLLFRQCNLGIINIDDPSHSNLLEKATCQIFSYGKDARADLRFAKPELLIREDIFGAAYDVSGKMEQHIELGMPGKFNIYNSLAALSVSYVLGLDTKRTLESFYRVSVRGRVELVPVSKDYHVIIDYAHNEEEVKSLLSVIKEYKPNRLICVYGGGGNRAKARRYSMGELCGEMAELSILTADNPRDEEVSDINQDIIVGIQRSKGRYIEIEDRRQAIYYALDHAEKGDLILLLGKGHEEYQEIKGSKYDFSEKEVLEEYQQNRMQK